METPDFADRESTPPPLDLIARLIVTCSLEAIIVGLLLNKLVAMYLMLRVLSTKFY